MISELVEMVEGTACQAVSQIICEQNYEICKSQWGKVYSCSLRNIH